MAHPFRFAIQTGPFSDRLALVEFARKIEDQGYAELYSYDHIGAVDPFLPLLVAAEATPTLRFGPLVLNNEFHNPVLLARTAATFDLLSGGRLVLGMGTGYMQWEHDASDIELRAPGARVTRFDESIAALRALLDKGAVTTQGQHITLDVEDLGVRPQQQHVPILLGGHGRRVVSIAAKQADIFQFTGLTHEPGTGKPSAGGFGREHIAKRSRWLKEAAGDRYESIELSTLVQVTKVGDDTSAFHAKTAVRMDVDADLLDATPFMMIGSRAQVVEKLEQLREEFGIHHVVSRDPDDFAPIVAALAGT